MQDTIIHNNLKIYNFFKNYNDPDSKYYLRKLLGRRGLTF